MPDRRGLTYVELLVVVVMLGLFLACVGFLLPFDIAWRLASGWVTYPLKVAGEVTVEWSSVIVAVVATALFTGGLHLILTRRPSWKLRQTVGIVLALLFAFVAGTSMIGITHQLTWLATSREPFLTGGREGNARGTSINHLKQLGLALHNYHDAYESLPPGAVQSSSGRPVHSWQALILPYLDQKLVSDQLDLSLPWDAAANAEVFATSIEQYSSPRLQMAQNRWDRSAESHFAGNIRVLRPGKPLTFDDITDGQSQTLIVGEVGAGFKPWGDPTNLRDPALGLHVSPHTFGFSETESTWFLHADGSVHEYHPDTNPAVLKALATPAGGEEVLKHD